MCFQFVVSAALIVDAQIHYSRTCLEVGDMFHYRKTTAWYASLNIPYILLFCEKAIVVFDIHFTLIGFEILSGLVANKLAEVLHW